MLQVLFLVFCFFTQAAPSTPYIHAVYLTWESEDTAATLVVNALSTQPLPRLQLKFNTAQKQSLEGPPAIHRPLKDTPLHIYSFSLKQLNPRTLYSAELSIPSQGPLKTFQFKTLPQGDEPLEIVSGGDLSPHPDVVTVAKKVITEKTDVVLLGGDLAYEDGDLKKYELWLKLFSDLNQALVSPDGRLLPLIVAIGNHEVNKKTSAPAIDRAPFYLHFFPQNQNRSYFHRRLSTHTVIVALDSGHLTPHQGDQAKWLDSVLQQSKGVKNKMALYHVPLYPSFRDENDSGSKKGREAWLPLFDKHGLTVALENHDHAFKRTPLLKNHKVVSSHGTIYAGDGCWGVAPRPAANNRWYLAKVAVEKHLWRLTASSQKLSLVAIDKNGKTLDSFTLKNDKVYPYEK